MKRIFDIILSVPVQKMWLTALLIFPIVLWILPGDFFDNTGLEICPSKIFLGIECFGCGLTRSVMHMHHFQFDDAVFYNGMGLVAYPILIVLWFTWVHKSYRLINKSSSSTRN